MSLPLLIPSAPLAAVRVANLMAGSGFSVPSTGSGARVDPSGMVDSDESASEVFRPTLPFLLLSLMLIVAGLPSACHHQISEK
jgi:hypothetical protein